MADYTQYNTNYNVDYVVENLDPFKVGTKVYKSASSESVYVTYTHKGKDVKVRFSNHMSNAQEFGDVLNGNLTTRNEILAHLGLIRRVFIPDTRLIIETVQIKKKAISQYEIAQKTIKELYSLGKGADISQYKGMVAKDSNYLILGNTVEEIQLYHIDRLGNRIVHGHYIYINNRQNPKSLDRVGKNF